MNDETKELAGVRIVVIDDSRTIRYAAETLLGRAGATVLTAEDGFAALSLIADNRPDVIFADVTMPRLDGYQTCALVKNNPAFRDIPVIMLSARDALFDRARGRLAGCEDYLTKPFTGEELLDAVKRHLPEHRPAAN
ncbi:MAG: response regulator [Gammaproteobacteria bacterium]